MVMEDNNYLALVKKNTQNIQYSTPTGTKIEPAHKFHT